jgi:hypothetical protein
MAPPTTAGRTPAAVRLKYLTKQLSQHRDRIAELQCKNEQLELLCSRLSGSDCPASAQTAGTVAGSHTNSTKVMRLESDLAVAKSDIMELKTQIESLEDENARLRAARGRKPRVSPPSGGAKATRGEPMASPLTPTDEYSQLLLSLKVQAAEMARESAARAAAEFSASRAAPAAPEAAPPASRPVFTVLPLVQTAAGLCQRDE